MYAETVANYQFSKLPSSCPADITTLDQRRPQANFSTHLTPQNQRYQLGGGRSLTTEERRELEVLQNLEEGAEAPKPKEIEKFSKFAYHNSI